MSSYIIAGSSDSLDTAYCEEIARKIQSRYKKIDFRIVIKHPSEWEDYLNQICRIYGFLNKTNPIIYTYHGKIIGNKDAFVNTAIQYFGLDVEKINISQLSTKANVKLANEEFEQKRIIKNNIRTISQKINQTYSNLLKQGFLKYRFKDHQSFLANGIEYSYREVPNLCPPKQFIQTHQVTIQKEDIQIANIDLMALSIQDQVKPEEGNRQSSGTNQPLITESVDKMSEVSRKTNKLLSSVMSKDGDSKHNKESNHEKQEIVEEQDDVADFTDINMSSYCICDLGENFYLSFQKEANTHIPGEMLIYCSEAQNNDNCIRIYNDGRAVLGHHTLIKQVHYIDDDVELSKFQLKEENQLSQTNKQEEEEEEEEEEKDKKIEVDNEEQVNKNKQDNDEDKKEQENKQQDRKQNKTEEVIPQTPVFKSKTQPNILPEKQVEEVENLLSEMGSDLNLISNLNYHTLYILKPLSVIQLKMTLYVVRETNTVATLQFLPENPNPKIKVFSRKMLLGSETHLFAVEKFIKKQIEDGELEEVILNCEEGQEEQKIQVHRINGLNFTHLYFNNCEKLNEEKIWKTLKLAIDELLNLEEKLKKEIGYNIIFTQNYILLIALTDPYKVNGTSSLYFDGLAYLGLVHLAKVVEGYSMKANNEKQKIIPQTLAHCSGFELAE